MKFGFVSYNDPMSVVSFVPLSPQGPSNLFVFAAGILGDLNQFFCGHLFGHSL